MACAGVGLDSADVIGHIARVFSDIGLGAVGAFFLGHPGDKADGAFGMDAELREEMNGLHGDDDSRAIVNGSSAEVP
jgi:hypothetical protein